LNLKEKYTIFDTMNTSKTQLSSLFPRPVGIKVSGLFSVFLLLVLAQAAAAIPRADLVIVDKSKARLYLVKNGKVFREYAIALGAHPRGHKQQQGDERTPEGRYILDAKNPNSRFHRSIHISYPNREDRQRARARGVDPGGAIMIHGQPNGWQWLTPLTQLFNWTDGCIAVRNADMDEIWDSVLVGTPIEIRP